MIVAIFLCLVARMLIILLLGVAFGAYNSSSLVCHPDRRGAPAERQVKDHSKQEQYQYRNTSHPTYESQVIRLMMQGKPDA